MSERNERRRERESRRQRERSREQRRARRESRKGSTTQQTLASGTGTNPTQQSGVPAGQQESTIQQPATGTMAGQQLPGQQVQQPQQLQQPSEQQGIAQQPATQQFQPQQWMGQQPTFRQPSNYTPQAPLAVGVPTGGAQAFGGAAQPGQQFGAAGAPTQSVGGTPAAGSYAGTAGGQLASQPSEIYPEAFADHLTEEARDCLDDCIDVSQVAAWCSDRCLEQGPGMAECNRLCNEAATLGAVTAEFIAKDSVNLPAIVDAYVDVAERATDELGKFDAPHTNEAEMVIERSIDSSLDVLESV